MEETIHPNDPTQNRKHNGKYDCIEVENIEITDTEPVKKIKNLKFRFMKTLVLFLSWLSLGLSAEIIGPAIPLLKKLTNTNTEEIGRALAVRGFAMLFGAIVFGVLSDKWRNKRNLFMLIIIWLMSISVICISYCRNLWSLIIVIFISGFGHGSQDTVGNPCLASLWDHRSTGPFSFMHAGYGLGASIAPLLFQKFAMLNTTLNFAAKNLTFNLEIIENNKTIRSNNTQSYSNSYNYPFFIISCYGLIIGAIFIIYILIRDPIEQLNIKTNSINFKSSNNQKKQILCNKEFVKSIRKKLMNINRHKLLIIFLIYLSYIGIVGVHFTFGNFLYSYAIKSDLKISENKAYNINSIYWIGYCLARIINSLIAIRIQPFILYTLQCLISLVLTILFIIYDTNELFFMIFCGTFVTVMSPLYPTMMGYINCHIEVTSMVVMVISFGLATGTMVSQYTTAYFVEYVGYYTLPWILFVCMAYLNVINFIMYFVFKPRIC